MGLLWNRVLDSAEIEGEKLRVSVVVRENGIEWLVHDDEPLDDFFIGDLRSIAVSGGEIKVGGTGSEAAAFADVDRQLRDELREAKACRDYLRAYLAVMNEIAFCAEKRRRDILDVKGMLALEALLSAVNRIKHDLSDGVVLYKGSPPRGSTLGLMRALATEAYQ